MKLRQKIYLVSIALTVFVIFVISSTMLFRMVTLGNDVISGDQMLGETVSDVSTKIVEEQISQRMQELAISRAEMADREFHNLKSDVQIIADIVTDLYENGGASEKRQISPPQKENAGKLAVQLLLSERIEDVNEPKIREEISLLSNAQDALKSINSNSANMASNYIATKSGLMVQADWISDAKFDEAGNILPYEADQRPWYIGASTTQAPFFTSVSRDAHGTGDGIMCGIPFYKGNEFMGVAGAGIYLNDIKDMVMDTHLGDTGKACILNENGQVIYSSMENGELATRAATQEGVRKLCHGELLEVLEQAMDGGKGIGKAMVNGENYYIAYAPMETIEWTFLVLIKEAEVAKPTVELMEEINTITGNTVKNTDMHMKTMIVSIVVVAIWLCIVVFITAYFLATHLVKSIQLLTEKVKKVDGENLDFTWELNTNDETQILAEAFGDMTRDMKNYIVNITEFTAEKEKISAELNVAAKIQEDMLPQVFPPFPERNEFDIYASMDPAKEVGGDFYDFFMIDEDHMGFVVADVSSKGVPAALFMVISKTLIKNHTCMGNGDLSEVFCKVNNQLCEGNDEGMFVTAWMAVLTISTGELEYVNAGHNPMLWNHTTEGYDWIQITPGFVLAGLPDIPYECKQCVLKPGDRIFLYTDGVSEAQNPANELFGEKRLLDSVNKHGSLPLEDMVKAIREDVDAFVDGADQFDDITMLAFEYKANKVSVVGEDSISGAENSDKNVVYTFPATDASMYDVLKKTENCLDNKNCDEVMKMSLLVAVEEIFVNIAHYAYRDREETGEVQITMHLGTEPFFYAEFKDSGIPYNPLARKDPDITLSAEKRAIGGLGIYMVKQTMDEVSYRYEDNYNIFTVKKIIKTTE